MEKNASPWFYTLLDYVKQELHRPELNQQVISPLVKKILWALMPYGIGFIALNFFTTILAVGMVIYVRSFYIPFK
jgi:hypothetical protein